MPEYPVFGPAARTIFHYGWDFARKSEIAGIAPVKINHLAGPAFILHNAHILNPLLAFSTLNVCIPAHPEIVIEIKKNLAAFRIRAKDWLKTILRFNGFPDQFRMISLIHALALVPSLTLQDPVFSFMAAKTLPSGSFWAAWRPRFTPAPLCGINLFFIIFFE